MTDHPTTPPPELVQQWLTEGHHQDYCSATEHAIARAARWGADQELEACCEWLVGDRLSVTASRFRAARRPKPPSRPWMRRGISRRALAVLDEVSSRLDAAHENILRRALEQLDD